MKYLALALSLVIAGVSFGQDTKAQNILDKFSTKVKGLTSFYVEFTANIKNTSTGENSNTSGKGWVKGDKYNAVFGDLTVISNGKKTWSIVSDEKSVYESDASANSDDNINPKKLLTIWEKGFKNKYEKEETLAGETVHMISLFPIDPKKVDYVSITVYISKKDNTLKKAIMKNKAGTVSTYTLSKFTENPTIEDTKFIYNPKNYPGYKVVKD